MFFHTPHAQSRRQSRSRSSRPWHSHILLLGLFMLIALVGLVKGQEDPYKRLGVPKNADDGDIKRAYRKLSRKYHPDKNPDPEASQMFAEISNAYEILSDTERRSVYDRYGHEGLKQHDAGGQGGGRHNPFDVFSNFFGGRGGQQERRGPDGMVNVEVGLEDMYTGKYLEFKVPRRVICDHCRGTGAASDKHIVTCKTCGGRGVTVQKVQVFPGMFTQMQSTCNTCAGQGKTISKPCPHCSGQKVMTIQNPLSFYLPPGAQEGYTQMFDGDADESPDYDIPGDIHARVTSRKDGNSEWRRKDAGLYRREVIDVGEALLGFEREVRHLDGKVVRLERRGTTQPGHVEVLKGQGMPQHGQLPQGDMYVEYTVLMPSSVSDDTRAALEKVFGTKSHRQQDEL